MSDALRSAVVAWSAGPTAADRVEIRRLVRLSDREREQVYLISNENLLRLIELAAP